MLSDDMTVVGGGPRPRALIRCGDDELAKELGKLFPAWEPCDKLSDVGQLEWDVLVSVGDFATGKQLRALGAHKDYYPAPHLYIITFGAKNLAFLNADTGTGTIGFNLALSEEVIATQFGVPNDVPRRVASLVRQDLIPSAQAREDGRQAALSLPHGVDPRWRLEPFAKTLSGDVIAGKMEWGPLRVNPPAERGGELWFLPDGLRRPSEWIKAALEQWRRREPERFVHMPGWQDEPRWAAPEEIQYVRDLLALEAKVEAFSAEAAEQRKNLEAALAQAHTEADAGHRRLLTARGEDLAVAVADALMSLGFEVDDMDTVNEPSQKLEDLRVRDADAAGWEALVEVRGHKHGATPHDLTKINRFSRRYRDEEDRWPPALWYIVNQFVGDDPASRPPVLATHQPDVDEFEAQGGLVMDTVALFDLLVQVAVAEVDPAAVRAHLRTSTGRYSHPA